MLKKVDPSAPERVRVALVFGGRSPEFEVYVNSARNLYGLLKEAEYDVVPIGIDQQGKWVRGMEAFDFSNAPQPGFRSMPGSLFDWLSNGVDVVFPQAVGDTIQGACQLFGIPFVGGDSLNQSLCLDKISSRGLLHQMGIPQPDYIPVYRHEDRERVIAEIEARLSWPVYVKPSRTGSGIGMAEVNNSEALREVINSAFAYDYRVIVEQSLDARRIHVAALGAEQPFLSLPAEVELVDSKQMEPAESSPNQIPAKLSRPVLEALGELAGMAWRHTDCYGMARFDFMVTDHKIYLEKIDSLPGFAPDSIYATLMGQCGYEGPALMRHLVSLALKRNGAKARATELVDPIEY